MLNKTTAKIKAIRDSIYNGYEKVTRYVNPLLLVIIGTGIVSLFFTDYNYITSAKYASEIVDLKKEIRLYRDSLAIYQNKLNSLSTDKETLEKIAREDFNMHSPDEDVYIVTDSK